MTINCISRNIGNISYFSPTVQFLGQLIVFGCTQLHAVGRLERFDLMPGHKRKLGRQAKTSQVELSAEASGNRRIGFSQKTDGFG